METRFWIVLTEGHLAELEKFTTEEAAQKVAQAATSDSYAPVYVLEAEEYWTRIRPEAERVYLYR